MPFFRRSAYSLANCRDVHSAVIQQHGSVCASDRHHRALPGAVHSISSSSAIKSIFMMAICITSLMIG
ncbi:hypothetical protein PFWH6_3130 [Pseudomonas fluorescens WH6]|nr:hypothetical protein PFWH6_3130 [Pseudomonas fluorescens WH6]